ncbi:MAG: helix-turn-helix domain-containing protein [Desulfobacter sp.]
MDTAVKIRALRLLKGYDQQLLAEHLGMQSATTVNRWEQRISIPRTGMLMNVGKALGVNWPWLQDSGMPFDKDKFLQYRPLSPYIKYSDRWVRHMCATLPDLFKHLCSELGMSRLWSIEAPCQGGIAIAANNELAIEVISVPELHAAMRAKLSEATVLQINNSEYLDELCACSKTSEFLKRCGIDNIKVQPREPELASKPSISLCLNAEIGDNDCCKKIDDEINCIIDNLIKKYSLSNVKLRVDTNPSKSGNEIICDLIFNKQLKKIAKQLLINSTHQK